MNEIIEEAADACGILTETLEKMLELDEHDKKLGLALEDLIEKTLEEDYTGDKTPVVVKTGAVPLKLRVWLEKRYSGWKIEYDGGSLAFVPR